MADAPPFQPDPVWFRPLRARRGPRPTLSREEITRTAIELADAEGLEALSMRRIAAKLDAGALASEEAFEFGLDFFVEGVAVLVAR